jgi:hypothetical protein
MPQYLLLHFRLFWCSLCYERLSNAANAHRFPALEDHAIDNQAQESACLNLREHRVNWLRQHDMTTGQQDADHCATKKRDPKARVNGVGRDAQRAVGVQTANQHDPYNGTKRHYIEIHVTSGASRRILEISSVSENVVAMIGKIGWVRADSAVHDFDLISEHLAEIDLHQWISVSNTLLNQA